jgi:hypothetical protein
MLSFKRKRREVYLNLIGIAIKQNRAYGFGLKQEFKRERDRDHLLIL